MSFAKMAYAYNTPYEACFAEVISWSNCPAHDELCQLNMAEEALKECQRFLEKEKSGQSFFGDRGAVRVEEEGSLATRTQEEEARRAQEEAQAQADRQRVAAEVAVKRERLAQEKSARSQTCPQGQQRNSEGQCVPNSARAKFGENDIGENENGYPGHGGYPTTSAAEERSQYWEAQFRRDQELCRQQAETATQCCLDPVRCVSGVDGGQEAMGILQALVQGGGSALMGQSPEGMRQACQIMQVAGLASLVANGGLGLNCRAERNSCKSTCSQFYDKWNHVFEVQCTRNIHGSEPECPTSLARVASEARSYFHGRVKTCESYYVMEQQLMAQAAQSGLGAGMAQLCKDTASASTGFEGLDKQPIFNTDCTDPANAHNPACIDCRGPNAASNPFCRDIAQNQGVASGFHERSANFGTRPAAAVGDPFEMDQLPPLGGSGSPEPSRSRGIQGGSGGGMPGGGGGGFGGADSPPPGHGPGHNTDVLQGFNSGGGYSTGTSASGSGGMTASGSGGGGFGGYGTGPGGTETEEDRQRRFNLAQYLPGGAKDPTRKRGLAAQDENLPPDIHPSHVNIFQAIHDRYRDLCVRGELIGCPESLY